MTKPHKTTTYYMHSSYNRNPPFSKVHIPPTLLSSEPKAAAKRSFKLVRRCRQFLLGFLAKGHLSDCHVSLVCQLIRVIMR